MAFTLTIPRFHSPISRKPTTTTTCSSPPSRTQSAHFSHERSISLRRRLFLLPVKATTDQSGLWLFCPLNKVSILLDTLLQFSKITLLQCACYALPRLVWCEKRFRFYNWLSVCGFCFVFYSLINLWISPRVFLETSCCFEHFCLWVFFCFSVLINH